MKGTYDNHNYIFVIKHFHKRADGNGYAMWGGEVNFDSCDGLTVGELFQYEKQKAAEQTWYSCDGLEIWCASIDEMREEPRTAESLARIYIDENNLYDSTIEYALGNKMISNYSMLNDQCKKKILTFLERYVADYHQVREFAQTGKNFLEGVDPLLGISAQGTARPKGR